MTFESSGSCSSNSNDPSNHHGCCSTTSSTTISNEDFSTIVAMHNHHHHQLDINNNSDKNDENYPCEESFTVTTRRNKRRNTNNEDDDHHDDNALVAMPSSVTMMGFSKSEQSKLSPYLSFLLPLSWMFLVIFAISSTFYDTTTTTTTKTHFYNQNYGTIDDSQYHHRLLGDDHQYQHHHHHASLFPLTTSDYVGFICATLGLMVAAGGGIGGGGILVPIYSLIFGFSAKHAIPLSNVTVLGGAVANTVLNARKRHPLADRPLVDWDLILVMEPLTIAGALIGAFLNKVLPETILTVMLVVLLSFTAYTSLKKGVKMYKLETKRMREQGIRPDGTKESELTRLAHQEGGDDDVEASERLLDDAELQENDDAGPVNSSKTNRKDNGSKGSSSINVSPEDGLHDETIDDEDDAIESESAKKQQLAELLETERNVPMPNIKILVAMFVVVLFINIVKGGGAFPSPIGIRCGSKSFWMANAIMLGWIITITLFVRAYLVHRYRIKQRVGYQYVEGDIKWDPRATIVYPSICCLAGFFAGMFGVGTWI